MPTTPQLPSPNEGDSQAVVLGRSLLSIALLAAAAGVFFWLGEGDPPEQVSSEDPAPAVQTAAAARHNAGLTFTVDGVVQPYRDLQVAAESGGVVVAKSDNCRVGRPVAAGEVLVEIDPRDYQLEIRRLEEELKQAEISAQELTVEVQGAEGQIRLAEQTVALNQREVNRMQEITTPGAVTESELDTARRDLVNARITLQTQRDQLQLLKAREPRMESVVERTRAELAAARLALERCVIRAPIAGVVTESLIEKGGYVQQGTLVFTVRDTARLDVRCSLRADQLALVWAADSSTAQAAVAQEATAQDATVESTSAAYLLPETPVTIIYGRGERRFTWQGVLARYDGAGLDPETRMAPCLVRVDAPQAVKPLGGTSSIGPGVPPTLLVGMFVEVRVRLEPRTPLLSIPVAAVHPGGRVWVVEGDQLRAKTARVAGASGDRGGGTDEEQLLVFADVDGLVDGLVEGDRVVTSPLASPADGQRVRAPQSVGGRLPRRGPS